MKFLTIEQLEKHENNPLTLGQLRHHLLRRKKNGLITACRKIGKRVYVREDLFFEWLDNQHEEADSEGKNND